MSKLSIVEAVKVIPVSESKLRRDLKSGKVSCETAKNGKKVIDASELERAYGLLPANEVQSNGTDSQKVVSFLEAQVIDLKRQLEKAEEREDRLLDMLSTEQEKTRQLMLPAPKKKAGFFGFFRRR